MEKVLKRLQQPLLEKNQRCQILGQQQEQTRQMTLSRSCNAGVISGSLFCSQHPVAFHGAWECRQKMKAVRTYFEPQEATEVNVDAQGKSREEDYLLHQPLRPGAHQSTGFKVYPNLVCCSLRGRD